MGAQIQNQSPEEREAPDVGEMVEVVLGLGFADYGDVEGWEGWDCVVEGGLVAHFMDVGSEEETVGWLERHCSLGIAVR